MSLKRARVESVSDDEVGDVDAVAVKRHKPEPHAEDDVVPRLLSTRGRPSDAMTQAVLVR